ncbi:MAG: alpha/beta hydrolase [Micavibrio sp.]|nr:alpha/beta hydrolase [Micavibrio sp.]|tara:strand:+ start:505 stop:1179 length:675 start_codon:yes stop_codon:yes gene_type:complete
MPEVLINGPEGRLEGRYYHSKTPNAPLALILHPHPEHGGTMNNKVSFALYQIMAQRGFSTLRFNFRGVGNSQGTYDNGEGELSDAAAALDWMQDINKNAPYVWVGGFSFGAWIGMQLLMRRPEIQGFISVAPPANTYDFNFLAPCPTNGLILRGDKDTIVTKDSVEVLIEKLNVQQGLNVDYREMEGANHFFRDKIPQLAYHVHDHMNQAEAGNFIEIGQKAAA